MQQTNPVDVNDELYDRFFPLPSFPAFVSPPHLTLLVFLTNENLISESERIRLNGNFEPLIFGHVTVFLTGPLTRSTSKNIS